MSSPVDSKKINNSKKRNRKIFVWGGAVAFALVTLFLLVVFIIPTPTARYIIESQLERLGINHEGIDTVHIDLWNSEVSAGPVKFQSRDARQGEIGEVGFHYRLAGLFEKRAFIDLFFIRGVDLAVDRHEDGSITFNGIGLEQIAGGGEGEDHDKSSAEEGDGAAVEFGIEDFEFTDSVLVLQDYTGGSLTLELERLALANFSTWDPQTAGSFELEGTLNGIALNLRGSARPFNNPITIDVHSQIQDVTIDKVAVFTGPTGLTRQAATVSSEAHHEYVFHPDGRVEGASKGTYTVDKLDLATAEGELITLDHATLEIDLASQTSSDKSLFVTGEMAIETTPISMTSGTGETISAKEIAFDVEQFSFKMLAAKRDADMSADTASGNGGGSTGSAPTIVQLILSGAESLARNALRHHLEIGGRPSIVVRGADFAMSSSENGGSQTVQFEALSAETGLIESKTLEDGWQLTAALSSKTTGALAASEGAEGDWEARVGEIEVKAETIGLETRGSNTSLDFALATGLRQVIFEDGALGRISVASLDSATTGMSVANTDGVRELTGPVTLAIGGLESALQGEGGEVALTGETFGLEIPALRLAGDDQLVATLSGDFSMANLAVKGDGDSPLSAALGAGHLGFKDVNVKPVAADAEIEGVLEKTLEGLDLRFGTPGEETTLALKSIQTRVEGLNARFSPEQSINASVTTNLNELKGSHSLGEGNQAQASIASVEAKFSSISVEESSVEVAADAVANGLSAQISDQSPQTIDLRSLKIEGLNADPEKAVEVARIVLEGLDASVNDKILTLGGEGSDAGETATGGDQGEKIVARLGELSITGDSRIDVTDGSIDPPMKLAIAVENARIGPIDTAAPETQTSLEVETSVNENAVVRARGWASPLQETPDFDLSAEVEWLPLPPFSPYVGDAVGMNIDSGTLNADMTAAADNGALEGQIDVLVDDLYLEPLSEEGGADFEASFGVPINFAVGILKDNEGKIDLGFPVAGTVDEPEIDYSEVISKALTGAMTSLFPINWFGDDGRTFEIEPVVFAPGTADPVDDAQAVADEMGSLLAKKPNLTLRLCGKATAEDLIVLRGGEVPSAEDPEATEEDSREDEEAQPLGKPTQQEVDALLALAVERKELLHEYLVSSHEIDPSRLSECRTSYSIEDPRPPRAEFRL